jgi:hypothetical protein
MIEIKGNGAESIVFDGNFVMKYRHHGKEESAQNPATTAPTGRRDRLSRTTAPLELLPISGNSARTRSV